MRVVIADDSFLIRERLQEMLGKFNQVEVVGSLKNGAEALKALQTLKPELAIIDIKMPGLSGLEILTEIRKENKALIFVILTLYSTDYYQQMALDGGADFFFSKVDDFEKVSTLVADMLKKGDNKNQGS